MINFWTTYPVSKWQRATRYRTTRKRE